MQICRKHKGEPRHRLVRESLSPLILSLPIEIQLTFIIIISVPLCKTNLYCIVWWITLLYCIRNIETYKCTSRRRRTACCLFLKQYYSIIHRIFYRNSGAKTSATMLISFDEYIHGRAGGILERVAHRVADDRGLMRRGSLPAVCAPFDIFFRVVPRAASIGHHDGRQHAGDGCAPPAARPTRRDQAPIQSGWAQQWQSNAGRIISTSAARVEISTHRSYSGLSVPAMMPGFSRNCRRNLFDHAGRPPCSPRRWSKN